MPKEIAPNSSNSRRQEIIDKARDPREVGSTGKRVMFYLTPEIHEALRILAFENRVTQSALARAALEVFLDENSIGKK